MWEVFKEEYKIISISVIELFIAFFGFIWGDFGIFKSECQDFNAKDE